MYEIEWQKPDWDKWSQIPKVALWQGISLSCDVEPKDLWNNTLSIMRQSPKYKERPHISDIAIIDYLTKGERWERLPPDFRKRMEIARANVGMTLRADKQSISCCVFLSDFAAWAEKLGWQLPEQFPYKPRLPIVEKTHQSSWPWGTYETKFLWDLAAAAEHFWKDYDSKHAENAPTNETVSDWLVNERGMTENIAKAMATILRPDNLPAGPRKTRQK